MPMAEEKQSTTVQVVDILDRFDILSAGKIEALLDQSIQSGARNLVCDFSKTEYMSSAGIRVIISTAKRLQKMGGTLAFCCLMPEVDKVFRMTGLLGLFQVFPTRQEAIESLGQ